MNLYLVTYNSVCPLDIAPGIALIRANSLFGCRVKLHNLIRKTPGAKSGVYPDIRLIEDHEHELLIQQPIKEAEL